MKGKCIITIFLIALLPLVALGQRPWRLRMLKRAPLRNELRQYADSLQALRDSLYADSVSVPRQLSTMDEARIFMPLTFYKDVSHEAFSLTDSLSPVNAQLLSLYLRRPDLVSSTESQLEKAGPTLPPATVTERPKVTPRETVPDEPEAEPVHMVVFKPNFWNFGGDYYLQFLQNYISSNWYKGGESNYSMVGSLTLRANYNNKQKVKWDNTLEMKLGFQTARSDSLHRFKPTENLLRYTGKLGLQAHKRWYYTFQLVANTQFMRVYPTNRRDVVSDFMSPFNLNASLGMDYSIDWLKGRLRGSVHIAPFAYNMKYVDRKNLAQRYGIDAGHHALHDYGSQLTLDATWRFTNNLNWHTRFYAYTTYERSEMEWENTFNFQFNKYIATQLFVYPRFDDSRKRDDHHGYFMYKEYLSLGFTYSF